MSCRRCCLPVLAALALAGGAQEEQRAAVCLSGDLRGGPEVLRSVEENLLRPLRADVFVYMPLKRRTPSDAGEVQSPSAEELLRLYALPGLVALHVEVEDATALLLAETRQRQPTVEAAERVHEMTLRVTGNWLGGIREPAPRGWGGSGRMWWRPGKGLLQQLSWRRCLEMVSKAEAGGRHYDWVISSRTNIYWEHPHLPLELLSQDAIWIPEGMDWGGLNDRHAVIPRRAGTERRDGRPTAYQMYLDAWRFIAEGKAAAVIHMALQDADKPVSETGCDPGLDGPVEQPCLNMENWLALRLRSTEVKVKRLPRFDWVVCQPGLVEAKHEDGPRLNFRECQERGTMYRYDEEHALAVTTAQCFRSSVAKSGSLAFEALQRALSACWCPAAQSPSQQDCDFDTGSCWDNDFFSLCHDLALTVA